MWADNVSTVTIRDYYQLLTDSGQGNTSNDSLHHEIAEALKLHSPYTPMNPTWLFEGTFENWLSMTYPNLELSKKVRPSRRCPLLLPELTNIRPTAPKPQATY